MRRVWFIRGLRKGVLTERENRVFNWSTSLEGSGEVKCPTDAIRNGWDSSKCIFCRRCYPSYKPTGDFRIAHVRRSESTFKRSFHLYPIDVGSCGGCNHELKLISSPQYDLTRFGIFFTNTPRHADAILVMGVVSPRMREALLRAYEAMPEPKLVIALGTCAASGRLFGDPVERYIGVDVMVPGCPPNPLTILDALIKAKGGKGV